MLKELMDKLNEPLKSVSVIDTDKNHLTATEKAAILAILNGGLTEGKVGKKSYFIKEENGIYTVTIKEMGRGMMPVGGSELRLMSNTVKCKIK